MMSRRLLAVVVVLSLASAAAAQRGRGGPPQPVLSPRAGAPIDLTGYWVSVVTEDWRWRMATPPKGDYQSLPLNAEARKVADAWDPAKDEADGNQCKPFGAGAIVRQPGRVHITWQDDQTLKLEFDAGTQTRLVQFAAASAGQVAATPQAGARTWQGQSVGEWIRPSRNSVADLRVSDTAGTVPGGGGAGLRGAPPRNPDMFRGGSLKVTTTNFRDGYLRSNGVPYSENASLVEYLDVLPPHPNGDVWLVVSSVFDDPRYLTQTLYLSTQFKKEPDGSKFKPTPCRTDPPAVPRKR